MTSPVRAEILTNIASGQPDHQTTVTANIKRRYGILFNEGPGYLLVDYLSEGSYSVTMLVQSLEDGQIYVRKLHSTQPYRDGLTEQCEDVRNVVSQSHVPALMSSRYYETTVRTPSSQDENREVKQKFTTPATVWRFCNGGTVNSLFDQWDAGANHKIPEAVIWNFMTSLLRMFIDIQRQGTAHRDTHGANFLLHWPENARIPEICLADFGLASKYPQVADANFSAPWTGTFDVHGTPSNHTMTFVEQASIQNWYAAAASDMRDAIRILSSLIFSGRERQLLRLTGRRGETAQTFLRGASQQNSSVNGYSAQLVQALSAWSNILDSRWNQPVMKMTALTQFLNQIQAQARVKVDQFLSNPAGAHLATLWMRPTPHQNKIAVWKDPTPLLAPVPVDPGPDTGIFFNVLTYALDVRNPPFHVDTPSMSGSVRLRQGQFRVAELAYDLNTFHFRVTRIVNSLDEVSPPSPEDDTQFDWGRYDDIARQYHFIDTAGSSVSELQAQQQPTTTTSGNSADSMVADDHDGDTAPQTTTSRPWLHDNLPIDHHQQNSPTTTTSPVQPSVQATQPTTPQVPNSGISASGSRALWRRFTGQGRQRRNH